MTPEQMARGKPHIGGKPVSRKQARAHQTKWLRDNPEAARKIAARIGHHDPGLARNILARSGGRPPIENPKKQVTLRLDADIVDHFRRGGAGWQTRINDTLRQTVKLPKKRTKAPAHVVAAARRPPKKTKR